MHVLMVLLLLRRRRGRRLLTAAIRAQHVRNSRGRGHSGRVLSPVRSAHGSGRRLQAAVVAAAAGGAQPGETRATLVRRQRRTNELLLLLYYNIAASRAPARNPAIAYGPAHIGIAAAFARATRQHQLLLRFGLFCARRRRELGSFHLRCVGRENRVERSRDAGARSNEQYHAQDRARGELKRERHTQLTVGVALG